MSDQTVVYKVEEVDKSACKEMIEYNAYRRMVLGLLNVLAGWYSFKTGKPAPKTRDVLK